MNNFKLYLSCVFFTYCTMAANLVAKSLTDTDKADVRELLSFVENTRCRFVRNGDEHSDKDAAKHIKRKFEHF